MLNDSLLPKHVQLRAALLRTIDEELRPGAMIPSERDLTTRYDVSRATVRAAISRLVHEGRLTTVPGRGTVVTRPRVESNLHLASFTQDMRRRGHRPSTVVLSSALVESGEATALALDIAPGDLLWEIERLRLADEEPMAHEVSWYPEALFPGLGDEDLTASLYATLESTYGVVITDAQQTTWAEPAGPAYADVLAVAETAPLLVFDRVSSSNVRPVEQTISRYRGDRYQLSMSLQRGPSIR
ncbi:GntR family transcriptional regulator [Aeromicrobium sp.]|uniref:GntR family transcriptional regulator n=1 Tax=Aeromicrobium sp. TaxID=1871063 RepID=UPI0030C27C03